METFWLEQRDADVPAGEAWLAPDEVVRLRAFRVPSRRAAWRLGRWTAKRALAACFSLPADSRALARLSIVPAPSGAPRAFWAGEPAGFTISLSHRAGRAICAVARGQVSLGCDLELIEARSDAFIADYFTPEERTLIARAAPSGRDLLVMLFWSAKECALKALEEGLRLDTRSVRVTRVSPAASGSGWSALSLRTETGRDFDGWWRVSDDLVYTVAASPAPAAPVALSAGSRMGTACAPSIMRLPQPAAL